MGDSTVILDPVAPARNDATLTRRSLDQLAGKVVGFVDNAKPNFNHLADDLAGLLVERHGVAGVVRQRKRGQVPVSEEMLQDLAAKCDAVITGSGD